MEGEASGSVTVRRYGRELAAGLARGEMKLSSKPLVRDFLRRETQKSRCTNRADRWVYHASAEQRFNALVRDERRKYIEKKGENSLKQLWPTLKNPL